MLQVAWRTMGDAPWTMSRVVALLQTVALLVVEPQVEARQAMRLAMAPQSMVLRALMLQAAGLALPAVALQAKTQ